MIKDVANALALVRKQNRKTIFVIPGGDAIKAREEAQHKFPFHEIRIAQFISQDNKPHAEHFHKLEKDWY